MFLQLCNQKITTIDNGSAVDKTHQESYLAELSGIILYLARLKPVVSDRFKQLDLWLMGVINDKNLLTQISEPCLKPTPKIYTEHPV